MDIKGIIRSFLNLFRSTRNYGVIEEPLDSLIGTAPDWTILSPTGQWTDYPWYEYQNIGFEKMACVTYSFFNCCEMIGIKKGYGQFNFSDRFTAQQSDTSFRGNTFSRVFDSVIKDGVVSELLWRNDADNNSWANWYKEPSEIAKATAKKNRDELSFSAIRIMGTSPSKLKERLKYSPLWITLFAYGDNVNGIYQRTDKTPNHAVSLVGYKEGEYWLIYDHYKGNEIRKLSWDYYFGAAYNVNFIWKSKEK